MGFLGFRLFGWVKLLPVQTSLKLCSKRQVWYVGTHTYVVSENISFSTKTP